MQYASSMINMNKTKDVDLLAKTQDIGNFKNLKQYSTPKNKDLKSKLDTKRKERMKRLKDNDLEMPSVSKPVDLESFAKHFATINSKMNTVFVKNNKKKSNTASQPRFSTDANMLVGNKMHIPTGLFSRRRAFNEQFEIRRGNFNLKEKYLKKFNDYAIGASEDSLVSSRDDPSAFGVKMGHPSSDRSASNYSSNKSIYSGNSNSSKSIGRSQKSKKKRKTKKSKFKKSMKGSNKSISLMTATMKDNPNFFQVSELGIKQLKRYEKSQIKERTPFEICYQRTQNNSSDGNTNENLYISDYLVNNIDFFKGREVDIMPYIARKLQGRKYKPGEIIIRKGDVGDCMYILYKGDIRIIWGDEAQGQYVDKYSGFSFGADALLDDAKRSATVRAISECDTLVVMKTDFDKVIKDADKLQKLETFKYLKSLDFFKKWTFEDLHAFNEKLKPLVFKPDDKVYSQGENSNMFYILFKGTLIMESLLDLDLYYKYPQGKKKWMVTKMTRRVKSKIAELKEGDLFGHQDFLNKNPRTSTVYSFHESKVFYINIAENVNLFNELKIFQLKKAFPDINFQEIGLNVIESFDMIKKYRENFMNGIQMNYTPESNRESFQGDPRVKKLRPWLNRAKNNKNGPLAFSNDREVTDSLNSKILSTKYKYYEVGRDAVFEPTVEIVGIPNKDEEVDEESQE